MPLSGYATSLTYVDKLCRAIDCWNLTRFNGKGGITPYLVEVSIPDLLERSQAFFPDCFGKTRTSSLLRDRGTCPSSCREEAEQARREQEKLTGRQAPGQWMFRVV